MKDVTIKSIFSEAWQLYKSNWQKLTLWVLLGYLLPLALFFVATDLTFSDDAAEDCAPCAFMIGMFVLFLLIVFVSVSISTKSYIRAYCYNKYENQSNNSDKMVKNWSLRWFPFEFIITGIWIFVIIMLIMMSDFAELIIGMLCILGTPVCIISLLFMFAPYLLCNPQIKLWRSLKLSMILCRDNADIFIVTVLIRNIISLMLFCTGIGIVVAVPFSIMVNAVLFRKIGIGNNHSSSFL